MKRNKPRLSLHQPETYQVKVPGAFDVLWFDDASSVSLRVEKSADGQPISILTGTMDQAALQGLLRQLYGLGLPLISVVWVEFEQKNMHNEG